MKYYDLVKKFVDEAFGATDNPKELMHFERTVYWLQQLNPDIDEADRIAAYAHDIERAFRDKSLDIFMQQDYKADYFTIEHPAKGAAIVADLLTKNQAPQKMIAKVKRLIEKHELGGDADQNLIMDADSISYFENQVPFFLERAKNSGNKEKIREKFNWMFKRITSPKAQKIARPMYEEAISKLEKISQ